MPTSRRRAAFVRGACALAMLLAGPAMAGEAWVGTYRHRHGLADCELVVVRADRRVEYRGCGLPTRIWRQLDDGVELLELHPDQGYAVRYAPGDLRALDREPDWSHVSGLAPPALRTALGPGKAMRTLSHDAIRYRGRGSDGRAVELDWLPEAALPALYRVGDRKRDGESFELQRLQREDDKQAFATTSGLREIDGADLGD
jgi:hypothetical protein